MKSFLSLVVLSLFATAALAQHGAVVVNVGGSVNCVTVKGESGFDATSYVLSGTEGKQQPGGGAGSTATAPSLTDLTITKHFDACSEQLIREFLAGRRLPTVTLVQYAGSGAGAAYAALTITLTDAMINNYQVTGAPSVLPIESLGLTYTKVCIASITQNADGSLQSPVRVCYDVLRNKVN